MKRIIIGALLGASTVPLIILVGWMGSLLFDIEFHVAMMYGTATTAATVTGAHFARLTAVI